MTSVLCLNVGSSSVKAALFDDEQELKRATFEKTQTVLDDIVSQLSPGNVDVVAHRVVHGGPDHDSATIIDDALLEELHSLTPLAPLHLPPALQMITNARAAFASARHIACFDTAFHRSIPEVAQHYALPESLTGTLIRRYGFHGLSCEYAVMKIGAERAGKAVIAHLGSGCSITAIKDGRSIDTSMGFTPLGGIVMATRAGDLDPGVLFYLLEHGHDAESLASALNHESGLEGIAGINDMRALLQQAADGNAKSQLAIDLFCYRIVQQIGAYATTLEGIDTLVFTGGIGEHADTIRQRIVKSLGILQPFEVVIVPADEEAVMTRQSLRLNAE